MLFICIFVFIAGVGKSAARVFCQDRHSTPWTPLGYSCPVNCASVIIAVNRLRSVDLPDYLKNVSINTHFDEDNFVDDFVIHDIDDSDESDESDEEDISAENNAQNNEESMDEGYNKITFVKPLATNKTRLWHRFPFKSNKHKDNKTKSVTKHDVRNLKEPNMLTYYNEMYKILNNTDAAKALQYIFRAPDDFNDETVRFVNKLLRKSRSKRGHRAFLFRSSRRGNTENEFMRRITYVLNSYGNSQYIFSEDITMKIFRQLLGPTSDLRYGMQDVQKLGKYLRQALAIRARPYGRPTITLKSRFCLNSYVPGCFCLPGYVEKEGQCVLPGNCFPNRQPIERYLARVHVT